MSRVSVVVIVSAAMLAGCGEGSSGSPPDTTGSPAGETETSAATNVVLGDLSLDDGRRVVLKSHEPAGATTGPCLTLTGVDKRTRGCGRAPSEREPSMAAEAVVPEAIVQVSPSAPVEVYGAAVPETTSIEVSYSSGGETKAAKAALFEVVDSDLLSAAKIDEPFDYFLVELPADAQDISATALTKNGQPLGDASYANLVGMPHEAFIVEG